MTTSLRFGAQTVQAGVTFASLLALWRFFDEETCIDSIWTMDHLVVPIDDELPEAPCFESWTLLAAAAMATRRLRLGCLVSANTFRHPALLAKMAATVDHASEGRLNVGLGAGWHEAEHRAFGVPLPPLAERLDRLEEAAALLRAVFDADKPVDFHGEHYRLEAAPFLPGFVQRPHPPLLVGGGGERRTLRIVARYADVANVIGPVSVVRRKLGVLRDHCARVGRDFAAIEKTVHMPIFANEDAAALAPVRAFAKAHYDLSDEQVLEEIPVGTAAHVRAVLERYAELGVSGVIFPAPGPWDYEAFRRLDETVMRRFA